MEPLRIGEICILNKEILICVYRLTSRYTWLLQRLSVLPRGGVCVCVGFGFVFFLMGPVVE